MRYAIVIEPTAEGCSAYVPDLPGCIATARTKAEVGVLIAKGMTLHLAGLREDGETNPVGWVERSDTHRSSCPKRQSLKPRRMG